MYDAYVTVPPDVKAQDEAGQLWDILNLLRFAILRARPGVGMFGCWPAERAETVALPRKSLIRIFHSRHECDDRVQGGPRRREDACATSVKYPG